MKYLFIPNVDYCLSLVYVGTVKVVLTQLS